MSSSGPSSFQIYQDNSLETFADDVTREVVKSLAKWGPDLNIVIVDFYDKTNIVQSLIALNTR